MREPLILHVAQPTSAGVAVCVEQLARYQHQRDGLAVAVACPSGGWLGDRLRAAGIPVEQWEASRSPGLSVVRETRRLRETIDRLRPDVIHLHSSKAGLVGRLAAQGHLATIFHPNAWSFLSAGLQRPIARRWEKVAQNWTNLFLTASDVERQVGVKIGIRKPMVTVRNGIDLDRFPYADCAAQSAARLALDLSDAPLAVCIGRLCDQKGQDILLRVWPDVVERVRDARLVLVGDGPDRERLELMAADNVDFVGEQHDVWTWLAAADVAVQPSRWEGLSYATLEALAVGRPVVAFDVAGMREAVGPAGEVVSPTEARALARAAAARLTDPAGAFAEGRVGRERVEAAHDARIFCERVTALSLELIGHEVGVAA
jgi:glycosyltransferase involved in cell wall biosynthesis